MTGPVLALRGLTVDLPGGEDTAVRVVDGLDLTIERGQRVALVGESGSGKSVTAASILQLMPEAQLGGSVRFHGDELIGLSARGLRRVRGARIGMIFQDPMTALDPVMTVVDQVAETLVIHGAKKRAARERSREVLDRLGVLSRLPRGDAFPHELSGGMRQRVGVAMAVVAGPDLLIADEPTTALDVRVQAQVLELLDDYTRDRGMSVLLITHDLGIVAGFADRVSVLYAGRLAEEAPVDRLFAQPRHPYTEGLLASVPRVDADPEVALTGIPGSAPTPAARPSGCPFHPRCPIAEPECAVETPALISDGHSRAACLVRNLEVARA